MKLDRPAIILIGVMAVLFVGTLLAYPLNPNEFDAEVSVQDGTATVTMTSSVESAYVVCAVSLSNDSVREVLVYQDESYESYVGKSDEDEKLKLLSSHLKYMGKDYRIIDADGLKALMSDTSNASRYDVVVFSGALPCNVYSKSVDLVSGWMAAGGIIDWFSESRFGYYSAPLCEDFVDWETDQPLESNPFGLHYYDGVQHADVRSEISDLLGITQNIVDFHAVIGDSDSIVNLGYVSEDGRYSVAYAKFGAGGIVISGGDLDDNEWTEDISFAKVIGSGVCDWTSYESLTGYVTGTKEVTIGVSGCDAVYVYLGTMYPRFGSLTEVRRRTPNVKSALRHDQRMNETQALLLEMYKDIARILDAHGIPFYVNYGTAIGALRHDGFIPWDDDIDVNIWEEDIERVKEVLQKELDPSKYLFRDPAADTHPHVMYIRGDIAQELKDRTAIFIDLFPIMRYPHGKVRHIFSVMFIWGIHVSVTAIDRIKPFFLYRHLLWIPRVFKALAKMMVEDDTELTAVYTTEFQNEIFPASYYGTPVMHAFEDTEVPLPVDEDRMLRVMFGDYMVPPPEDKRHGAKGFPLSAYNDYLLERWEREHGKG